MIDEKKIFQKIDVAFLPLLKNTDLDKPRLMVSFSAVPGSGKTTIARVLTKQLDGIYVQTDGIRRVIIESLKVTNIDKINEVVYTYLPHLFLKLSKFKNGLWIIDSTINFKAKEFFQIASTYHAKTFVIRLNVPADIVHQRIIERGDRIHASTQLYIENMPNHRQTHKEFGDKYKSSIDVTVDENSESSIPEIIRAIQQKQE